MWLGSGLIGVVLPGETPSVKLNTKSGGCEEATWAIAADRKGRPCKT